MLLYLKEVLNSLYRKISLIFVICNFDILSISFPQNLSMLENRKVIFKSLVLYRNITMKVFGKWIIVLFRNFCSKRIRNLVSESLHFHCGLFLRDFIVKPSYFTDEEIEVSWYHQAWLIKTKDGQGFRKSCLLLMLFFLCNRWSSLFLTGLA